jgi:hypothetical protein
MKDNCIAPQEEALILGNGVVSYCLFSIQNFLSCLSKNLIQ